MTRPWRTLAVLLLASAAGTALAAGDPWGNYDPGNFGTGHFDLGEFDWSPRGDFDDPSRFASDVDEEFEADDILALNLGRESQARARALGFRVQEKRALRSLRLWLVRLRPPPGMDARAALAALRKADPKGFYDYNAVYRLASAPSSCQGIRCYGRSLIGWSSGACSLHTRIGIVDSALDTHNPALAGRDIRYRRLRGDTPMTADTEHGTAIAALLVGAPDSGFPGLLPDAELVAIDVFAKDRDGHLFTDAARLAAGLDWVAGQAPSVVNLSIAGPDSGVLHTAVRRLVQAGIPVVAAAGNLGPAAPPQYPAAYREVIAVTAVDRRLQVYARANRGAYVALSAPGVGIWTAGPEGSGVFLDGTSLAAPFATAAAAVLRAREPAAAPESLLRQLQQQARDLGPPGNDPIYGAGLLQSPACGDPVNTP